MTASAHPCDPELLAQVLRPYKEHCKYLKSVVVTSVDGDVSTQCEFAIPESCYIDDTGHLNSVEVNICYNQVMYYTVAAAVRWKLLADFAGWTMEDYWKRQLPDILIARFESTFRRPVNPRAFRGEFAFQQIQRRAPGGGPPLLVAHTTHRYHDASGGRCDGKATLAFPNLPD
ncbi:FcoT family thioesterase [Streptomyces sp. NPDC048644]|uniref:(2E)-enoyl-ACP glycyltransferase n=1 Tax=Streptomyces sp. NPDC048644 TaxID=3365582 RepID=UPI0037112D73